MQLATAGPAAQLTDVYRGAERGLERSGVRGGSAVQAQGELARDRANSIAQLTTGQQGGAAEGLSRIGAAATGQGVTATAEAGGTANTGSEIAGKQAQYDTTNERGDIANAGKSAGEILKAWQNRGQGNSGWKPWTWGKDNVPTYSGSAG